MSGLSGFVHHCDDDVMSADWDPLEGPPLVDGWSRRGGHALAGRGGTGPRYDGLMDSRLWSAGSRRRRCRPGRVRLAVQVVGASVLLVSTAELRGHERHIVRHIFGVLGPGSIV